MKKNVDILLSNSLIETTDNNYEYNFEEYPDTYPMPLKSEEKVVANTSEWVLSNKQSLTLIKLSQQLNTVGKKDLEDHLIEYLHNGSHEKIKTTIILALIHLGRAGRIINEITEQFKSYNQEKYVYDLLAVSQALKYQSILFTEDEVDKLNDWANDYYSRRNELGKDSREYSSLYATISKIVFIVHEKTNIILTRKFTDSIETNFNPDINTDEIKIKKYVSEKGMPIDLIESLDHINEQINNGTTPFHYKNTMDSIRAFTERMFEVVAKSIDEKTKIDGKDSEAAAKYFKDNKLISGGMADIIKSLRHFISNDGVHRLKSRREDARIAKNLVVEISLYLLTRLEERQL